MPDDSSFDLTGRPILVAHDGGPRSRGAVCVAAALARDRGARPVLLHVLDPTGQPVPPGVMSLLAAGEALLGEDAHAEQERLLREQSAEWAREAASWPAHVRVGQAALQIAAEAERQRAALVLMGMHAHGRAARLVRDETTLHVMRVVSMPVLALLPSADRLPQRVIVGVQLDRASDAAALAAAAVAAPGATLQLVHVRAPEGAPDETPSDFGTLLSELGARITALGGTSPARVEHAVLHHRDPAAALIALAEQTSADLIAVASRRHDRLERWLVGSVTTRLARDGGQSLLVVPPAAR